ncbi:MAG: indole-3-glycerol phosphate synthase TrpC [Patescibacteria group bacterium]
MTNILEKIVAHKRAELTRAQRCCPIETLREVVEPATRNFRAALLGGREEKLPRLIAEIKRKSPSKNEIAMKLDVAKIVQIYNQNAAAISILTDYEFFGGSLEDLEEANFATAIPLLRKDFIFDEYQIYEARQFGADAILLIARILESEKLKKLIFEAKKLGMAALVEIHDQADLAKVLDSPAEIIGVNSRDLDTLEIDFENFEQLLPQIPSDKIIVAESGLSTRAELENLQGRVDAVLVGSSLLQAENIEGKLSELTVNADED